LAGSYTFLDAPDKHLGIKANEAQLNVLLFTTDRGDIIFRINPVKVPTNEGTQFIHGLFRRFCAAYLKRLNTKFLNFPFFGVP
jgi:hypothetical protein